MFMRHIAYCTLGFVGAAAVLGFSPRAHAHGGAAGDHLAIGYYYGHDATFEAPADPPWPATLLVDTHPWELPNVVHNLTPASGLLKGWSGGVPGFATLDIENQEFDGHGFFSFLDPSYTHGAPDLRLHLDSKTAGLRILNPTFLQDQVFPLTLGGGDFHQHMQYFVPLTENPALGTMYTATFHLSDASGRLADSEPFTIQFRIVPEPASLGLLAMGIVVLRRRR